MKHFTKYPCRQCGKMISNAGFANRNHSKACLKREEKRNLTMKHTKGPWQAQPPHAVYASQWYKLVPFTDLDGKHHPDFYEGLLGLVYGPGDGDAGANAELIALAPTAPHDCEDPECPGRANKRKLEAAGEMLEALIWVKDELVQFHGNVHRDCTDKGRLTCPTWEAIYKAREAITKAEGK